MHNSFSVMLNFGMRGIHFCKEKYTFFFFFFLVLELSILYKLQANQI